jgi:hypothetical protein
MTAHCHKHAKEGVIVHHIENKIRHKTFGEMQIKQAKNTQFI